MSVVLQKKVKLPDFLGLWRKSDAQYMGYLPAPGKGFFDAGGEYLPIEEFVRQYLARIKTGSGFARCADPRCNEVIDLKRDGQRYCDQNCGHRHRTREAYRTANGLPEDAPRATSNDRVLSEYEAELRRMIEERKPYWHQRQKERDTMELRPGVQMTRAATVRAQAQAAYATKYYYRVEPNNPTEHSHLEWLRLMCGIPQPDEPAHYLDSTKHDVRYPDRDWCFEARVELLEYWKAHRGLPDVVLDRYHDPLECGICSKEGTEYRSPYAATVEALQRLRPGRTDLAGAIDGALRRLTQPGVLLPGARRQLANGIEQLLASMRLDKLTALVADFAELPPRPEKNV